MAQDFSAKVGPLIKIFGGVRRGWLRNANELINRYRTLLKEISFSIPTEVEGGCCAGPSEDSETVRKSSVREFHV